MAVTTPTHSATRSTTGAKVAAVAAVLFGVAMFLTVASVNVPHDASDAELLDWWSKDSNRMSGVISSVFALSAAALLSVVANYVHQLKAAATSPLWRAFGRSMAAAFTAVMLIAAVTRSAVSQAVDVMDEPIPGIDTLRFATALNYRVFGFAVMGALALTILAMSVLALRTSVFARWAAYVGLACGGLMLAAVLVGYGIYTVPLAILWSVCLGAALRK